MGICSKNGTFSDVLIKVKTYCFANSYHSSLNPLEIVKLKTHHVHLYRHGASGGDVFFFFLADLLNFERQLMLFLNHLSEMMIMQKTLFFLT
jgi:hypothetical protein